MRTVVLFALLFITATTVAQKKGQDLVDSLSTVLINTPKSDKKKVARLFIDLSSAYLQISNYTAAASLVSDALSIAEELSDDDLTGTCFQNLGTIYFFQRNFSRSDEYNDRALAIYSKTGNVKRKLSLIKRIADNYLQQGDSSKAVFYYDSALAMARALGDPATQAAIYANRSILYNLDYEHKIMMAFQAKKIYDSLGIDDQTSLINIGNIGIAYRDIVRLGRPAFLKNSLLIPGDSNALLTLAEIYIVEAISKSNLNKDPDNTSYFTGVLAELQETKGDYKSAYKNIRTYYEVQDSIYSQANKNKIASLEVQGQIALRDKELALNKLSIEAQRKQRIFLLGGIVLFGVIAALLLWQNQTRRRANKALLALNKQLDEANTVKAKFFGILSHDIRSPIANLVNFLHLQQTAPDLLSAEQIAHNEKKITTAAENLLENMEVMLLWSKGQMKNFKPVISSVLLLDLFHTVQKSFTGNSNIQFDLEADPRLKITTDENYLQTILLNLTSNAAKALQNTADARITWRAVQHKEAVVLSITDNGPGVLDEALKALFEETSIQASHGLGLHIVRDLAKAIGCSTTYKSEPGSGTSFYLRLPHNPVPSQI
ncbi:MAG: tetratricopeptide repeat-containing sensor histidine kinase [Chitinophagaceae bacterium]|nr:tetratricopeptide repeat-containing sensor histidine kinase [Chitinophagaceae bacterium]